MEMHGVSKKRIGLVICWGGTKGGLTKFTKKCTGNFCLNFFFIMVNGEKKELYFKLHILSIDLDFLFLFRISLDLVCI